MTVTLAERGLELVEFTRGIPVESCTDPLQSNPKGLPESLGRCQEGAGGR